MVPVAKHILVIEDDLDMQHAIRAMLEPEGYRLTCCATGPAGLEVMRRDRPDLVLLDIMLASPTEGLHIAYEMRGDDLLRDIPIVMTSAIGQRMGLDVAREVGSDYVPADAYLEKPLKAAGVRETVRAVLTRREDARV
jgi:CheY-like chemotaxis protein